MLAAMAIALAVCALLEKKISLPKTEKLFNRDDQK
jgi:hypothetical protein